MRRSGSELVFYVMTRGQLRKARNIGRNRNVSLLVPLRRRFVRFLPPPTVQLSGRAEILNWTDEEGTDAFRGFWLGRRSLEAHQESHRFGENRICFLKITLDPVLSTYMVGCSIRELGKRVEAGAAKVIVPGRATQPA